ncbi:MAG: hypothetical protein RI544_08260, partial [Haloquadratum sp.]|nr:hypothetical protein [Haloquadratum sp.]
VITGLAIRGDIPELLGAAVGAIMSIVAGINALDLFVITDTGVVASIDPQTDIALILLVMFVINLIFIFDRAFSGGN